jgi:hypothetical protein
MAKNALRSLGWLLVLALAAGCPKKPSPEYEEAADRFSEIYRKKWEDAFLDPEMAEIEAKLRQVPSDSLNAEAAAALLKRIEDGRKRMTEENAEREASVADALRPTSVPGGSGSSERTEEAASAPVADAQDGGVKEPYGGMPLAELQKQFGDCFRETTTLNIMGKGPLPTWALRDLPSCRDKYPRFPDLLLVFDDGRLYAMPSKSNLDYRLPDGGKPPGR